MVSMGEGPLPYSELTGFSLFSSNLLRKSPYGKHGRGTFTILRADRILISFLESSQEFSLMVNMGEGPLPYSELTRFSPVS